MALRLSEIASPPINRGVAMTLKTLSRLIEKDSYGSYDGQEMRGINIILCHSESFASRHSEEAKQSHYAFQSFRDCFPPDKSVGRNDIEDPF